MIRDANVPIVRHNGNGADSSASAVLREAFGLTQAEWALAVLLCEGITLAEAGVKLGKRMPTLRSQVRRLFEKTDTRRQTALVLRLQAAMRAPESRHPAQRNSHPNG